MKNNEVNEIKKMYEKVITPEYDVKDAVLKEIGRQRGVPRLNKKVLIAAIVCLIILMVGTAGAAGVFDHMLVFKFPNENDQLGPAGAIPTPEPTPLPDPEDIVFIDNRDKDFIMGQFIDEIQPGEYRCAFSIDEQNGTGTGTEGVSSIESNDFTEIKNYIKNSKTPLPIPNYIPKGYEFVEGYIELYIDESILDIQPTSMWEEDEITYYIYNLEDGYQKNIAVYTMKFRDENDNYIRIRMDLFPMIQGGHEFGASDTAVAEYVDVKGYGESLLIYDGEKQYSYMYELALYKETDTIYSAVVLSAKIYSELMDIDPADHDYTEPLQNMMIMITADDITRREILKIGDNLK